MLRKFAGEDKPQVVQCASQLQERVGFIHHTLQRLNTEQEEEGRATDKAKKNLPFGGYHIFLFGDLCQIQPVAGRPMYSNKKVNSSEDWATQIQLGKDMYSKIEYAWELTKNLSLVLMPEYITGDKSLIHVHI